jgi:thioesterase domain-containing protein
MSSKMASLRRDQLSGLGAYEPPADELEEKISACWSSVTGFDRVGSMDDFFALGGTSIQAADIFSRLGADLGISLPLSTLYRAPTVRGLAAAYRERQPVSKGRVVTIDAKGNKSPLFVAPGIGGGAVGLAYLASALNADRPIFAFESRGLSPGETPLANMREIAAEFVADLRRVQPEGPYRLLGICWGGVAALEVARQLRNSGQEVAGLLMLDPPPPATQANAGKPSSSAGTVSVPRFIASRLKLYWHTLRELSPAERSAYLNERFRILADILRQRDLFRGDDSELRRRNVLASNRAAVRGYCPPSIDCPVQLLFTTDRPDGPSRDAREQWLEILRPNQPPLFVPGADTGNAISAEFAHHVADVIRPLLD